MKYKIIVPCCESCQNKFYLYDQKVCCIDCDKILHYECAVFDVKDERYMVCIDCFVKTKKNEFRIFYVLVIAFCNIFLSFVIIITNFCQFK